MANENAPCLLIVDDDPALAERMGKAMESRGYATTVLNDVKTALDWLDGGQRADFALIDLRLGDGSGLDVVQKIKSTQPDCRTVMMTAYGNIATAVAAVKSGAIDYLTKPADADAVQAALEANGEAQDTMLPPPPARPMSANRVRWEHIQRIYEQCNRNVSETARRLSMHRRTLQRILAKHAPQDMAE